MDKKVSFTFFRTPLYYSYDNGIRINFDFSIFKPLIKLLWQKMSLENWNDVFYISHKQ